MGYSSVSTRTGDKKYNVDGSGQMFTTCSSNQVQSSLPSSGSLLRGLLTLAHGTRYYNKQHKSRSRGEEIGRDHLAIEIRSLR